MLHTQINGQAKSTAQGQRVLIAPWVQDTVNTDGPQTIGTAAQQILTVGATGFSSWWIKLKNTSIGGQQIAIGFSNAVTVAGAGIVLDPGDDLQLENLDVDLFVIASAANAILLRFAMRTN